MTLLRDKDPLYRLIDQDAFSPKSFDIYGINEDGTEVLIERVMNLQLKGDGKYHTFPVANDMYYSQYRFHVKETVGRGALGYFLQLTRLTFKGIKG